MYCLIDSWRSFYVLKSIASEPAQRDWGAGTRPLVKGAHAVLLSISEREERRQESFADGVGNRESGQREGVLEGEVAGSPAASCLTLRVERVVTGSGGDFCIDKEYFQRTRAQSPLIGLYGVSAEGLGSRHEEAEGCRPNEYQVWRRRSYANED